MDLTEPEAQEQLRRYLRYLDDHIVRKIRIEGVRVSCFASYLLMCATLDGMGLLSLPHDPKRKRGSYQPRFNEGLRRMGTEYWKHREQLWDMRGGLAHQAVLKGYLTAHESRRSQHLRPMPDRPRTRVVLVHTDVMLDDLCETLEQFEQETLGDRQLLLKRGRDLCEWLGRPGGTTAPAEDLTVTPPPDEGNTVTVDPRTYPGRS